MNEYNDFEEKRINPLSKRIWLIQGLIITLVLLFISLVLIIILKIYIIIIIPFILGIYLILIYPAYEYEQWRYKITKSHIRISHGIFFTRTTNIPITKIQHIEINRGPFKKYYHLSDIMIYTAGSEHSISSIEISESEKIVHYLNSIIVKEA